MSDRPRKTARFSPAARARLTHLFDEGGALEGPRLRGEHGAGAAPLTSQQERLFLAEQAIDPSPLYHVPLAAHLVGALDVAALERALAALVRRHDVLRASFVIEDERPVVRLAEGATLVLVNRTSDLAGCLDSHRHARALELARMELRRPFDLATGPPLRAALWRIGAEEHVLLLTLHHLVCDAATLRIVCGELAELYAAERGGRPAALPAPALQHADHAAWERARAESAEARAAVDHFAERLRAPLPALDLPADRPRPARWTPRGAWRTRRMDPSLGASVVALAHAHGATPFQLFLAAFHALVARLAETDDLRSAECTSRAAQRHPEPACRCASGRGPVH
jgi:hypothetical protein